MAADETNIEMTLGEFAEWLQSLPEDTKNKKIWFIDITMPWKGKPLYMEESPTGNFVSVEDVRDGG
jgi:hypothetical protein